MPDLDPTPYDFLHLSNGKGGQGRLSVAGGSRSVDGGFCPRCRVAHAARNTSRCGGYRLQNAVFIRASAGDSSEVTTFSHRHDAILVRVAFGSVGGSSKVEEHIGSAGDGYTRAFEHPGIHLFTLTRLKKHYTSNTHQDVYTRKRKRKPLGCNRKWLTYCRNRSLKLEPLKLARRQSSGTYVYRPLPDQKLS